MSQVGLLDLVDARDFRRLFIDELGWNNPDRPPFSCDVGAETYLLTQIAGYKGLRIWVSNVVPPLIVQREIDKKLGQENLERLVVFAETEKQEWRWPRRAQTGGVNAKLLMHRHKAGESDPHLERQLNSIEIDLDEAPTLVSLLSRMRAAFDVEAESASVQAARLMGTLYSELAASSVSPDDATLLLARLLFLLFGDDSGMWKKDLFHKFLIEHTADDSLHAELAGLFLALNTDERLRGLAPGSPLAEFRYINGGLFKQTLGIPPLTTGFRLALLGACEFDWQVISPAIFGSMFQTVKDKEARRDGGEHYTTEENILKTIGPLFLEDLHNRLASAWNDKGQLAKLHSDLGRMRFLDPACGCGNFLVVAYRELRALELDLLTRRRDLDEADRRSAGRILSQRTIDVTGDIKVTLDHFYGIEIEEWPARIAETAMLLVDHLANQRMEEDFGVAPDRLPIKVAPTIMHGNALHADWRALIPPSDDVMIMGNPPFIGQYTKTVAQTADTRRIWGTRYHGYLDYVTCWYAKVIDYYHGHAGRWAFVSTNSVCQGEPVEFLWRPILDAGWRCRFAHRSFNWVTEATGPAGVHVSIVGFDKEKKPKPVLWVYPEDGRDAGEPSSVDVINPYLCAAPIALVRNSSQPVSRDLPPVDYGSKPVDGGGLVVEAADYEAVAADAIAAKYIRPFVGSRELVRNLSRWCLWLVDAPQSDLDASPVLRNRIEVVRQMRLSSKKTATNARASTPHLFAEQRQPSVNYLCIPSVVSVNRPYLTVARFSSEVVTSNLAFTTPDPDGFLFGVLTSSMFIAWMRAVGGRIRADLRFSNTFTYNSFPLPNVSDRHRRNVVEATGRVLTARSELGSVSLASLYEVLPAELAQAHQQLDSAVDAIFGFQRLSDLTHRQSLLFSLYVKRQRG